MNLISETLKYSSGLTKIVDQKTPSQLIFFVTNRCNARCTHCFYWQSLNKIPKDELNLREIKKISRSMGKIIWFFVSGGEPFMRPDLAEICRTFYQNNQAKSIVIPTNGILVEKIISITEKICRNCPKAKIVIQVSVDEIGSRHDRMRGVKGVYQRIENLIPKFKKLQIKYSNLALQINIVFCLANQNRIKTIYQELEKKFQPENICVSLIRGQPKENTSKEVNLEKYWQMHLYLQKRRRFNQYTPFLSYLITKKEDWQKEFFLDSFKNKKAFIPCLAGRQSAVLYPNGDLAVCELRKEKYGNLRKVNWDFNRLWQSQEAGKLREKVKNCYCTQECVYTTNVFLNPLVWPRFGKYLITGKL